MIESINYKQVLENMLFLLPVFTVFYRFNCFLIRDYCVEFDAMKTFIGFHYDMRIDCDTLSATTD